MTRLSCAELLEVFRQLGAPIPATLGAFRELTAAWQQREGKQLRLQQGPKHELYNRRCSEFRNIEENFVAYQDQLYAEFRSLAQRTLLPHRPSLAMRDQLRALAVRQLLLCDELLDRFLSCLVREQGIEFLPEPLPTPVPPPLQRPAPQHPTPVPPRQSVSPPLPERTQTPRPIPITPRPIPITPRPIPIPSGQTKPPRQSAPRSSSPARDRARPRARSAFRRAGYDWHRFVSGLVWLGLIYGCWRVLGSWFSSADRAQPPGASVPSLPKIVDSRSGIDAQPVDCGCRFPGTFCQEGQCRLASGMRWALSTFALTREGTRSDTLNTRFYAACVRASSSQPWSCAKETALGVVRDASHLNYYFKPSRPVVVTTEWLEQNGIDVSVTESGERIALRTAYAYDAQRRLLAGKLLFSGGMVIPLEHRYLTAVVLHIAPASGVENL